MLSERVSTQRTGRESRRASQATSNSSGYRSSLEPKAPPTSGEITRIWLSSSSSNLARSARTVKGSWVGL